jgi:hypothetical protein
MKDQGPVEGVLKELGYTPEQVFKVRLFLLASLSSPFPLFSTLFSCSQSVSDNPCILLCSSKQLNLSRNFETESIEREHGVLSFHPSFPLVDLSRFLQHCAPHLASCTASFDPLAASPPYLRPPGGRLLDLLLFPLASPAPPNASATFND